MLRGSLLLIIRRYYSVDTTIGICHAFMLTGCWQDPDTATSQSTGSGRNCSSVLILLASCQQTCMTYTIAVCAVKNS